jgi:hypothetical protein
LESNNELRESKIRKREMIETKIKGRNESLKEN